MVALRRKYLSISERFHKNCPQHNLNDSFSGHSSSFVENTSAHFNSRAKFVMFFLDKFYLFWCIWRLVIDSFEQFLDSTLYFDAFFPAEGNGLMFIDCFATLASKL
jgi:hypothetical protein